MRAVIYSVVLLLNVSVSRPSVFSLFLVKVEVFVKTISLLSTFLNFALYIRPNGRKTGIQNRECTANKMTAYMFGLTDNIMEYVL